MAGQTGALPGAQSKCTGLTSHQGAGCRPSFGCSRRPGGVEGSGGEPRSVPREPPEASSFARLGGGKGERLGLRLLPLILPELGRFFFPKSQKSPHQLQIDPPVGV